MKVEEIINPKVAEGVSAKGAWTKCEVRLDDGSTAKGFMPIAVGDEVTVEDTQWGPQFKPAKRFKFTPANEEYQRTVINMLKDITERLARIEYGVTGEPVEIPDED